MLPNGGVDSSWRRYHVSRLVWSRRCVPRRNVHEEDKSHVSYMVSVRRDSKGEILLVLCLDFNITSHASLFSLCEVQRVKTENTVTTLMA